MHITYFTKAGLRIPVYTWVFLIALCFFIEDFGCFVGWFNKQRKLFPKRTKMRKAYVYIASLMLFLSENGLTLYFKLQEETFLR